MPFDRKPEPTPVRRGEDVFAEEYRRAEARVSERLTKAQERILVAVFRRPMDVFDLADTVHLNVENTDKLVVALCKTGLAHRMYAEDEVSSTPTGRALLSLKDNANG